MNTEFSEVYDLFETKMQNHPDYFEVGIDNQLTDKEIVKIINKKNLMIIKQALPVLQRMVKENCMLIMIVLFILVDGRMVRKMDLVYCMKKDVLVMKVNGKMIKSMEKA